MFTAPSDELVSDSGGGFQAPADEVIDKQPNAPVPSTPWSSVPANAINDVKGMVGAGIQFPKRLLIDMPIQAGRDIMGTVSGLRNGQPFSSTPIADDINQTKGMANSVLDTAKSYVNNTGEAFRQHPVQMPMNVLGAAAPIIEGSGAFSKLGEAADTALAPARNALSESPILRKGLSWMGDVPEESVGFRMKNPDVVRNAGSLSDIAANDAPAVANRFEQVIGDLHNQAAKTLSTSRYLEPSPTDPGGAFTKEEVLGALDTARKNLGGVYTPEAQTAARTLDNISENLNKIRSTVSQNQVHDLIVDLDREIPWDRVTRAPNDLTLQDNALIDARTKLDGLLKEKNPAYAKIMEPLSQAIQNRNEFTRNFGIQKIKNQGYQPSNTTVSRILGATKEDRLATHRILTNTFKTTGQDIRPNIEAARVKADFEPDTGGVFNPKGVKQIFGRPAAEKIIDSIFSREKPTTPLTPAFKSPVVTQPMIDEKTAREILAEAGNDKVKARAIAKQRGLRF